MVATVRRMEVATTNLTNAETVGYKQERRGPSGHCVW